MNHEMRLATYNGITAYCTCGWVGASWVTAQKAGAEYETHIGPYTQ